MITNYYTLFHIAAELNHEFSGRIVEQVYTQYRSELVLSFQDTTSVMLIGCEPSNNYLSVRKTFSRARRNSTDIFSELPGGIIDSIFMHPTDRQLYIRLKNTRMLVVQIFGSKANVLLVDAGGAVINQFKKNNDPKDEKIELSFESPHPIDYETLQSNFKTMDHELSIAAMLKKTLPQFGPVLVKELLTRANLKSEQSIASLTKTDIEKVCGTAQRLSEDLLSPPLPQIYFHGTAPVRFSIIPLQHLSPFTAQKYDSVSEAVVTFRASIHREKTILHEKEEIIKGLQREYNHTEGTLQKIALEADMPKRSDQHEKFAKLLIANLHHFKKGDATALVEDFIDASNDPVEIPLDPHLSPAKNAERYFEKAAKSRVTFEQQLQHTSELTQRKKLIIGLLERMEEVATSEDLHRFAEENQHALAQLGFKTKKSGSVKKEEPALFRTFTVAGGFQVWAGKSGENNDLLSTRHTAKNDLWFHARGVGGSHVVLKMGTGKGEVSKQAIEQAASIAAYYSKMKNSKLVPVAMCEGKYVRKPKGVPAGTVTLEREKTILVEPQLPKS